MIMIMTMLIFSLFSLLTIIGLKLIEVKKQKKLLFSQPREQADIAVTKIIEDIKNFFSIFRENAKLFAISMRNTFFSGASIIRRKSNVNKLKFIEFLRNRGNFKKQGPTSFFLKNVSEYKNISAREAEKQVKLINENIGHGGAMKISSVDTKHSPFRYKRS